MKPTLRQNLFRVLALFAGLIALGTVGYAILEDWPLDDSLFMTVITISTVGYGEVAPLSRQGEIFSMILIMLGVGGAAYTFSVVTDYIVAGELRGALRKQQMNRALAKMNEHYIICGYGRVGQNVVEGLQANLFDIVVVDAREDRAEELEQKGVHYVIGDATDDAVLVQAGIDRASGLCTCLPSDADNVFTILSARTLNPDLFIISRCNATESERKLRIAGANQTINPYRITGGRMAAQLLHPGVVEFLDVIMHQGDLELRIEEIAIHPDSLLVGQTLGEAHIRANTGVNVLAIRRADGKLFTNSLTDAKLHAHDALIGLGTVSQLAALSDLAGVRPKTLQLPREE